MVSVVSEIQSSMCAKLLSYLKRYPVAVQLQAPEGDIKQSAPSATVIVVVIVTVTVIVIVSAVVIVIKAKQQSHSKVSASRVSRLCPAYLLFSQPRSARFWKPGVGARSAVLRSGGQGQSLFAATIGALMVRIGFRGPLYYNDYNYKTAMPRVSIGTGDMSRFGDEYLDNCQSLKTMVSFGEPYILNTAPALQSVWEPKKRP